MLQLNTLVRFIHSHSPARLSKFKKILARRPKSVPTPGIHGSFTARHVRINFSATMIFSLQVLHTAIFKHPIEFSMNLNSVACCERIQVYSLAHIIMFCSF